MTPHEQTRELSARIWNAFPVTEPRFAKLLGLLDIEAAGDIPTAAVTLGLNSRLRVNPEFVARHCQQDEALVMLVLHELWHVALGHTRLCSRATLAENWAFDAIINAQLCRLFPGPAHTRLFRELYRPDHPLDALLRPPEGWRTPGETWLPGRTGELHRQLYSEASASTVELLRLLADECWIDLSGCEGDVELRRKLLGDHAAAGTEATDPELLKELRDILAEWPMVDKRSGRDLGGQLLPDSVKRQVVRQEAIRSLRLALVRLAGVETGEAGTRQPGMAPVESIQPYGRDRRACLRELWGDSVPIHRTDLLGHRPQRRERVQVYLDVSGSMEAVIAPLYAALASLSAWIAPQVQLFSSEVAGISLNELRRGKLLSTQGTEILCVTGHILEHQVTQALIVTDGWVGNIPGEHLATLKRRQVRIDAAITHNGSDGFMKPLGGQCLRLPNL